MLTGLAYIFLLGLLLGNIFKRLHLPGLLGMLITGMILSPYALNALDESIINISGELRQLALVIILTRAGLALEIDDLKKIGRPAVLLCFVPACFEILAVTVLARFMFGISFLEAAIMGSVLAAVSPAVIVPRMLSLMEKGIGQKHRIPQLILAGASVDDIFVIIIFTALTSYAGGGKLNIMSFVHVPVSILLGAVLGILVGWLLVKFFRMFHMRDSVKILIILSLSFLLLEVEHQLEGALPVSGLLAIMGMGIQIKRIYGSLASRLSARYNKLWVAAEILLFVLVGATVNLSYALHSGGKAVLVVIGALIIRMIGVLVSLIRTILTNRERLFCMLAYTPKATVQAAIGGIPLSMGLSCGDLVLTVAVVAILLTAPFGAIMVDKSYQRLLN